jgi:hypothetical protein
MYNPIITALLALGVCNSAWAYVTTSVEDRGRGGHHKKCPPFNRGTFNINAFQLYPENADWDGNLCQVYFGYVVATLLEHGSDGGSATDI